MMSERLRVLRSCLPALEAIIPYFSKIEKNQCHTNFGELFISFEERMAQLFSLERSELSISCNGAMSLTIALLASDIPRGSYCLVPAWTFSGTVSAICAAGLVPYFLDVDRTSQTITPEIVQDFLDRKPYGVHIGAVVPVSAFGLPIDTHSWDKLSQRNNIHVVIDGAMAFDTVLSSGKMPVTDTPIMISLHATKVFGVGEGGLLLSKNKALIERARGISNFGFAVSRESSYIGLNGKMSEHTAAIGHAVLDAWAKTRAKRAKNRDHYIKIFSELGLEHCLEASWVSNTCNILMPGHARGLEKWFEKNNIETRRWWGEGCYSHPAYVTFPRNEKLKNTQFLSDTVFGLPISLDTTALEIERVAAVLKSFFSDGVSQDLSKKSVSMYDVT